MRKQTLLLGTVGLVFSSLSMTGCGQRQMKADVYDKDNNLLIDMRHLYFDKYSGGDYYQEQLEKKFKVRITFQPYNYANWNEQVNGEVNGDNCHDVFHANITNYNFVNYYCTWAKDEILKPLPDDLTRWPNLKNVIDHTSNIDALKINGKLYGIPIAKNTTDFSTNFSPFTYMYRRDWAKQWGVYQENDEYTWSQFETLLQTFKDHLDTTKGQYALCDVEWGYPSITNFYKQVPHCYAQDKTTGKYVNNYQTDEYIAGLNKSREFQSKGYYYLSPNTLRDGDAREFYCSSKFGVLYENVSYSNYKATRNRIEELNPDKDINFLNDATALMKIKNEDGQYCLEGTDNWFSMTLFDFKISDTKLEKILDILDWLLGEEGTAYAMYGEEGYDYTKDPVTGKINLVPERWYDSDGKPIERQNGPKALRYLASLGYDTLADDPTVEQYAIDYLNDWEAKMKTAYANGQLRVLKESDEVMWLNTPLKSKYSEGMRSGALLGAMSVCLGTMSTDSFKGSFGYPWSEVLNEINTALHK